MKCSCAVSVISVLGILFSMFVRTLGARGSVERKQKSGFVPP